MSRPSWSKAPQWAAWLAMDSSGAWYWFESEPTETFDLGMFTAGGSRVEACVIDGWRDSVEERPELAAKRKAVPATPIKPTVRLTKQALPYGETLELWYRAGWDDETLVLHGHAEYVK